MIPPVADDPDPTSQMPWPAARDRQDGGSPGTEGAPPARQKSPPEQAPAPADVKKKRLTTWDLITLSISMAGAQIAWTVELG